MSFQEINDMEENKRREIKTDLTHNIFVEAGAGAGKTSILITRIMNQLKSGQWTVDQLVAITFTNKAAQELKERISFDLRDEFHKAEGKTKEYLGTALREVDRMQVSTIHSFCFKLLMEKIFNSGMRMDMLLLEDKATLERNKERFANWYKDLPYNVVRSFKENFVGKNSEAALENAFMAICELDDNVVIEYDKELLKKDLAYYEAIFTERRQRFEALLLKELEQALGQKYATMAEALFTNDQNSLFVANFKKLYDNGTSDIEFVCKTSTEDFKAIKACKVLKMTREKANNINDTVKEIAYLDFNPLALEAELMAYQNALLMDLALQCRAEYRKHFDNQEITNDMLLQKARDLVVNDAEARASFAKKYRCIYVDEFQDTDHVQTELLFSLCSDERGGLRAGSLFVVGDPKQSIYRFRGADLPLYYETREKFKIMAGCKFFSLNYNFRSNENIVAFVNENNANLLDNYEAMISMADKGEDNIPAKLLAGVYHCGNPTEVDSKYKREHDVDALVYIITSLVNNKVNIWDKFKNKFRPIEYRDFLVLCYSTTGMEEYMDALLQKGVPVQISGAIDNSDNKELHRFAALFNYLAHPNYKRAREAAKQTVLHQIITGENSDLANSRLTELLEATKELDGAGCAYYLSKHLEYLLDQDEAVEENYLLRLQAQLQQMLEAILLNTPNNKQAMAKAFADYLANKVDRELTLKEDSNTVRFMNVHKSKGLEGKIVIVCKRNEAHDYKESSYQEKLDDGKYHLYVSVAEPKGDFASTTYSAYANKPDVREKSELAEMQEYNRLDYVEATRAMEALIFLDARKKTCGFTQYDFANSKNLLEEFADVFEHTQEVPTDDEKEPAIYDKDRNDVALSASQTAQQYWCLSPSDLEIAVQVKEAENAEARNTDDRPKGNLFGTIMHRCYELMVKDLKLGEGTSEAVQELFARQAILENMEDLREAFGKKAEATAQTYFDYLKKLLAKFATDKRILQLINSGGIIYTEFPFSLYISREEHPQVFTALEAKLPEEKLRKLLPQDENQKVWVNGKADLVVLYPTGKIVVVDYKSDVPKGNSAEKFAEIIEKRYGGQMELYRQMLSIIFEIKVENITGEFYLTE